MQVSIPLFTTSLLYASAQSNVRGRHSQQHEGRGYGAGRGARYGAGRGAGYGAGRGAGYGASRGAGYGAGSGAGCGAGNGGRRQGNGNRMCGNIFVDVVPVALTQAETDELLYMAEEEKMAHDVYEQFFNQYQIRIFDNIRNSEQRHVDLVRQALQLHGLADPTSGKGSGQFVNVDLGNTYTALVASGSTSLGNALRAGALIEETDINDLNDALQDTAVPYLDQMYDKLRRASENHLRAFVRTLDSIGEGPYTPTVLSADEYNGILN